MMANLGKPMDPIINLGPKSVIDTPFTIIYHHLPSIYHHLPSFTIIYHHLPSFIIINDSHDVPSVQVSGWPMAVYPGLCGSKAGRAHRHRRHRRHGPVGSPEIDIRATTWF